MVSVVVLSGGSGRVLAEEAQPASVRVVSGKRVHVRSEDGRFSVEAFGRFQLRNSLEAGSGTATKNELSLYRARVQASGAVYSRNLTYQVQLAFGQNDLDDGSSSPLYDAYVEYHAPKHLIVRAGQFLVPLDRARATLYSDSEMVDRSFVVGELGLNRSVGIKLYSEDLFGLGERLGFHVGVFSGEGRQVVDQRPGFLYVARVVVRPFGSFDDGEEGDLERESRPRLAVGLGGAFNHRASEARGTGGDKLRLGTFDYAHAAADVMFKMSGFSLFSELLVRTVVGTPVRYGEGADEPASEWSRSALGFFVQGGYMLTASAELAGRFSELHAIAPTEPGLVRTVGSREIGPALSWYIDGHDLKLQADYTFSFGLQTTRAPHRARMQMQVTF
jgi:hypothetical protein